MAAAFKDSIGPEAVARLAAALRRVWPEFAGDAFCSRAQAGLEELELKARVQHVATALRAELPTPWPVTLELLVQALPPPLEGTRQVSRHFWLWPLLHVVQEHGLEHPERSLDALREMTRRFSAEFAIRPYLRTHRELSLGRLHRWVEDPDPHVRRLVSEGSRPRLPWASRLEEFQADPTPTLALLDRLVGDPERYVQRSVANHLGDIAKDHPERAVRTAQRWRSEAHPGADWVARHGLRTLVKRGHAGALEVLDFPPVQVQVERFVLPARASVGAVVELELELRVEGPSGARVVIDYAVRHPRPSGRSSRQVYRGVVRELTEAGRIGARLRHRFRDLSTRRIEEGAHGVELIVQGCVVAEHVVDVHRS